MSWKAKVVIAMYKPLSLKDGIPIINPAKAERNPDINIARKKEKPALSQSRADVYAPMDRKAA